MKITVKTKPFGLPNYLRVDGPFDDSACLDVGFLFRTDEHASEFWDEAKKHWLDHVRKRRELLEVAKAELRSRTDIA